MTEPASHATPQHAPSIGGGRFALVAKIAEGGMAGVYRAWDAELEVWRAIKILLPEYANRDPVRSRFEREASGMAQVEHPHVVRVYDVVTDEALPYIVMELSEGGSLIRWLDAYGPMPSALACRCTAEVARGVGAAHAAGIVHRDVKPHNVLVSIDGRCKVTDFGIARIRLDSFEEEVTRTGATMGTIGYMAPEQRASAKDVDARADIYSLGALVYKLITGNILTDLFLVAHEPELLEPIPEPLHDLIIRATYHDRERRFPDTASFCAALADIQALLPDDPPDTPPLTIPVEEQVLDPSALAPFPEISELLRPDDAPVDALPTPPPAPDPEPVSDEPPLLPYTMPVVDPSLTPPAYVIDGLPSEPTPPEPAAPRTPSVPPPDPEPEFDWLAITPATRWLALAALIAWLGLLGLGAWGAVSVTGAGTEALTARRALYGALDSEREVLADLERQGVSRAVLQELTERLDAVGQVADEPGRWAEAERYVVGIRSAATSRAAVERAERLHAVYAEAHAARVAWFRRANTGTGRLAVGLGVAPAPQ